MRTQHSKPATRLKAVMKAVTVIRVGVFLAVSHSVPGGAAPILDVDKIMTTVPKVAGRASPRVLQDECNIHHVRTGYLRSVSEARKRITGVSGVTASPVLVIESNPNAYVIPLAGGNVTLLSPGMLELVGPDGSMAASLLGKVYAHLSMKRPLQMGSTPLHWVDSAVPIGKNVGRQTGDWNATTDAASTAFGVMRASLIRGAKKFFPDPIMGIRG